MLEKKRLSRRDERAMLMGAMMTAIGAEPETVAPFALDRTLRTAAARCLGCRHARRCQLWLGGEGARGGYRAFCPNAALFESMRPRR